MLEITIPERELYDERTDSFVYIKPQVLKLEHSLLSISKWESKWHKPFIENTNRTFEEMVDYVRCMTITPNVDPNVFYAIDAQMMTKITKYIDDPMTATTFKERAGAHHSRQVVTSELIYFWMIACEIPFECEKWHINRLMTLIRICDIKGSANQKMSKKDVYSQNRALNAARKAKRR